MQAKETHTSHLQRSASFYLLGGVSKGMREYILQGLHRDYNIFSCSLLTTSKSSKE